MMKPLIQIPFQNSSRLFSLPQLQCHRGYWVEGIPENTLESILEARRQGYQMVEFDVQVSADGVPVLFHDDNLCQVVKKNIQVSQLNYDELMSLFPVSRLEDVLAHAESPDFFNLEIKSRTYFNEKMNEAILNVIDKTGVHERVLVSSFNPWCLYWLQRNSPEIMRALLVAEETKKYFFRPSIFSLILRPHFLHLNYELIQPPLVKESLRREIPLVAWTVNEPAVAKRLLNQGVSSIITDRVLPTDTP